MNYQKYYSLFEFTPEIEHRAFQEIKNDNSEELIQALLKWLDECTIEKQSQVYALGQLFGHARKQTIDQRICEWLSTNFDLSRCLVAATFIRSYWFHIEDINPDCIHQFIDYIDELPLGSEVDKKVTNMLADVADAAVYKNLPDNLRAEWRGILLQHLDAIEKQTGSTFGYKPVVKLKQGDIRHFFQIYHDIDNRWRIHERYKQMQELCEKDHLLVQDSLKYWLTEYEIIHRDYEDLTRLAEFLAEACEKKDLDQSVYEWYQEEPSERRCSMMGWYLSEYWKKIKKPYLPCVGALKKYVNTEVDHPETQDGAIASLSQIANLNV